MRVRATSVAKLMAIWIPLCGIPHMSLAIEFAPPKIYAAGTSPTAVAVADFNGDGQPDIAVANSGSGNVSILLNNGDGTLRGPVNFNAGAVPQAIAVGDFNGDDKPDLAVLLVADNNNTAAFSVLLGNGDGSFQEPLQSPLDSIAARIVVNDFNLDNKADIAITLVNLNQQTATLLVFISNGDGTFQSAKNSTLPAGSDGLLANGDFNKDGNPDLVTDGSDGYNILLGKGDGTFQAPSKVPVADTFSPTGIQVVDLNRDGISDLVGYSTHFFRSLDPEGARSSSAHLSIFLGNNDGTFKPEQIIATSSWSKSNVFAPPVGDSISPPSVGDFNGDETVDLLFLRTTFVSLFQTTVSGNLMPGNGDGTFLESSTVNISLSPITVADLNRDGRYDLLSLQSDSVAIYLDTGPFVYSLAVTLRGEGSGSVSSNPAGISCEGIGGTCSAGHISPGTVYALTASPSASSTFAGWNGACTGADPNACTVIVNTNQSVTATFNVSPDFAVNASAQSLTVSRGGQANDTLTFPAQGGFSGTIVLTCSVSGPAPMPTCGISPNSVTSAGSAMLTVNAASLSMAFTSQSFNTMTGLQATLLPMGIVGFVLLLSYRNRRGRWMLYALLIAATVLPTACGGGSSTRQSKPQNYSVTVSATSGALQHSTTVSVTVQ
jgi:hypothetical protein